MKITETIAAIATPPGEGGIGIIRISGDEALMVGRKVLRHLSGKPIASWPERKVRLGYVVTAAGEIVDEVIYFYFKKNRSILGRRLRDSRSRGYQNLKNYDNNL